MRSCGTDSRGLYILMRILKESIPRSRPLPSGELEDIYPCASAKSKADDSFRERAQTATFKLQNGYKPYTAIWKHIMAVSLEDLKKKLWESGCAF